MITVNDCRHEDLVETMQPSFDVQDRILDVFPRIFAIAAAVCFHQLESLLLHGLVLVGKEIRRRIGSRSQEVAHKGKCNGGDSFDDVQPVSPSQKR